MVSCVHHACFIALLAPSATISLFSLIHIFVNIDKNIPPLYGDFDQFRIGRNH